MIGNRPGPGGGWRAGRRPGAAARSRTAPRPPGGRRTSRRARCSPPGTPRCVSPRKSQIGEQRPEGADRVGAELLVGAHLPVGVAGERLLEGGGEEPDTPAHLLDRVRTGGRDVPAVGEAGADLRAGVERGVPPVLELHLHPAGQHVGRMAEEDQGDDVELGGEPLEGQLGVDRLGEDAAPGVGRGTGVLGQGGGRPGGEVHVPLEDAGAGSRAEDAAGLTEAPVRGRPRRGSTPTGGGRRAPAGPAAGTGSGPAWPSRGWPAGTGPRCRARGAG